MSSGEDLVGYVDWLSNRSGLILNEFDKRLEPIVKVSEECVASCDNRFASCPPFFSAIGDRLKVLEENFDMLSNILDRIDI